MLLSVKYSAFGPANNSTLPCSTENPGGSGGQPTGADNMRIISVPTERPASQSTVLCLAQLKTRAGWVGRPQALLLISVGNSFYKRLSTSLHSHRVLKIVNPKKGGRFWQLRRRGGSFVPAEK